ncbi:MULTISPECIES: hypothetical protein [unclassified Wolbachia]|uniref:hypothetical protein n=1 Tax=unclassified Wolbachia TaxID=2640676 RepID=UPI001FD24691|nr:MULTISPECIES: hypothetical protein [unclassified Wolbachia]
MFKSKDAPPFRSRPKFILFFEIKSLLSKKFGSVMYKANKQMHNTEKDLTISLLYISCMFKIVIIDCKLKIDFCKILYLTLPRKSREKVKTFLS